MNKNKNVNIMAISNLVAGDRFRTVGCDTTYRATYVRVGESKTQVHYIIDGSDNPVEWTMTKPGLTSVVLV